MTSTLHIGRNEISRMQLWPERSPKVKSMIALYLKMNFTCCMMCVQNFMLYQKVHNSVIFFYEYMLLYYIAIAKLYR